MVAMDQQPKKAAQLKQLLSDCESMFSTCAASEARKVHLVVHEQKIKKAE